MHLLANVSLSIFKLKFKVLDLLADISLNIVHLLHQLLVLVL